MIIPPVAVLSIYLDMCTYQHLSIYIKRNLSFGVLTSKLYFCHLCCAHTLTVSDVWAVKK